MRVNFRSPPRRPSPLPHLPERTVKSTLLSSLSKEPRKHIREKLAHAVGEVAANVFTATPPQQWPELLPLVLESTKAEDAAMRETAMLLFDKVALYVGSKVFKGHEGELVPLLSARLQDSAWQVQLESIKTTVSVILCTSERARQEVYAPLMLLALHALSSVLRADEFRAKEAQKSLNDIAYATPFLFKGCLDQVVSGMEAICKEPGLETDARCLALELLTQLCHSAPGMMRRHGRGVTVALVQAFAFLRTLQDTSDGTVWLAQPLDTPEQTYDMQLKEDLQTQGEGTLLRLCRRIGGKTVAAPIVETFTQLMQSESWVDRRAGLIALLVSIEGCAEQLRGSLVGLVQVVLARVGDAHPRVRHAAMRCLEALTEAYCERKPGQPNFQDQVGTLVIPVLTEAMLSTSSHGRMERLRGIAADALTNVIHFQNCRRSTVEAPLDIMRAAVDLLKTTTGVFVKCTALGIVSATAELLKSEFSALYGEVVPLVRQVASEAAKGGKKFQGVRDGSITALTHIFHAVGFEACQQDCLEVLRLIADSLGAGKDTATGAAASSTGSSDSNTYAELTAAAARLAATMGAHFAEHLGALLPSLAATAARKVEMYELDPSQDDMEAEELAGMAKYELPVQHHGAGSHNATWVALDENAMNEKATAVNALFSFLDHLPMDALVPYVDDLARVLVPLMSVEEMETIRCTALSCAHRLLRVAMVDPHNPRHGQVMAETVLPALNQHVMKEADRHSLQTGLQAFSAVTRDMHEDGLGKARPSIVLPTPLLKDCLQALFSVSVQSLTVRNSMVTTLQEEDTDAEMQEEVAAVLALEDESLTNTVDSIGALVKIYKGELLPLLQETGLLTLYFNLADNLEPMHCTVRGGGLAFSVDVVEHCGTAARELVPRVLPHLLDLTSHEVPMMRQLATYGLGVVVAQHLPALSAGDVTRTVQGLARAAFKDPLAAHEDMQVATVNAISALIKTLNHAAGHAGFAAAGMTPAQLLAAIVDWLPVSKGGDEIEARDIHEWFLAQVAAAEPGVVGAGGAALGTVLGKVCQMLEEHFKFFFSVLVTAVENGEDDVQVDDASLIKNADITGTIPGLAAALQAKLGEGPVAAALSSLSVQQQAALRDPASVASLVRDTMLPAAGLQAAQQLCMYAVKYPSSVTGEGLATVRLSGLVPAATAATAASLQAVGAAPPTPPSSTGAG